MAERAYTVSEIDSMRRAIRDCGFGVDEWYDPKERRAEVEDRLRTYMIGNVDPDDLIRTLIKQYQMKMSEHIEMEARKAEVKEQIRRTMASDAEEATHHEIRDLGEFVAERKGKE